MKHLEPRIVVFGEERLFVGRRTNRQEDEPAECKQSEAHPRIMGLQRRPGNASLDGPRERCNNRIKIGITELAKIEK